MCEKQVDGILLVIIACILAAVLFGITVQMQVKDDCRMVLPKKEGKFCQKRDMKGNIYYVREDGKVEVIK
jgi:hypothetical protein